MKFRVEDEDLREKPAVKQIYTLFRIRPFSCHSRYLREKSRLRNYSSALIPVSGKLRSLMFLATKA